VIICSSFTYFSSFSRRAVYEYSSLYNSRFRRSRIATRMASDLLAYKPFCTKSSSPFTPISIDYPLFTKASGILTDMVFNWVPPQNFIFNFLSIYFHYSFVVLKDCFAFLVKFLYLKIGWKNTFAYIWLPKNYPPIIRAIYQKRH